MAENGKNFDVSNVRDALSAFSRLISATDNNVFDKIFDTLHQGIYQGCKKHSKAEN